MPGSSKTAFAFEEFRARSNNGIYGACIEELDWSTGEIMKCLKVEGLDENTLVIWTSDNGAFHARRVEPYGQNTPLRGTGGTAFEGGFRMPCIVRWPGRIEARTTSNELKTSMDLLPTFAKLADGDVPSDRTIDGRDTWPLLAGEQNANSPHEVFFYYKQAQLRAVRAEPWKLHLPVNANAHRPELQPRFEPLQLYDLNADVEESTNLADQHPG